MTSLTHQKTDPLHIENTVNQLKKTELQLPQAFKTYRSMMDNPQIGGGMGLIQSMINKLDYKITPHKDASEAEIKLVKKLNDSLYNMEGINKVDFLNQVLSMCVYGNSIFEMVFKYEKGATVFDVFSPIHPINVNKYVYKRNKLVKLELAPAENDGLIYNNVATEKELKGSSVMMFRLMPDLDHPLGRSLLDRCYMPWRKHSIVDELETVGVMKNLSGVLKVEAPAEYINDYLNNPSSDNALYIEEMFEQASLMNAGKTSYCCVASDTNQNGVKLFDITSLGNKEGNDVNADVILKRLEVTMLTTLYTDIMALGNGSSGSFALSDSKTTLLALFIDSILKTISETFSKAIKAAYKANSVTPKVELPKLEFEGVESLDFEAFSRGFQRLVDANIIQPDEELEEWTRNKLKTPIKGSTPRSVETGKMENTDRKEKEK